MDDQPRETIWQLASTHSRMIELAIIQRNWKQAEAIIVRARYEYEHGDFLSPDTPLSHVLTPASARKLKDRGVATLGDIAKLSAEDLRGIYNMTDRVIQIIESHLAEHGYSLRRQE